MELQLDLFYFWHYSVLFNILKLYTLIHVETRKKTNKPCS